MVGQATPRSEMAPRDDRRIGENASVGASDGEGRTVLFPTDGSEGADCALPIAVALARGCRPTLPDRMPALAGDAT